MANHHDTTHSDQGGGFWGCASTLMAIAVAAFAGIAGAALIFGGMNRKPKDTTPEPAPAAGAPAAATPDAATPTAAPPETVTQAPTAPAVANPDLPLLEVTMRPATENAMLFDKTLITAKEGQKVKITYINEHKLSPMQHNLLICKPGSKQRIIDAATGMMTDLPKWLAKDLIPESSDVLHHTKLLFPGQTGVIEFVAGPKGDYPYICTFPGHSLLMQGTLRVEEVE